jgi:probable rRNA maturation factor
MGVGLLHVQQGRAVDHPEFPGGVTAVDVNETVRSYPAITVLNRQRAVSLGVIPLRDIAKATLGEALNLRGKPQQDVLPQLDEVNVILVSDRRIAEIHRRFLNEPGPTDVITFQHGEIFVSTEMARRHARRFRTSLEHELRLYIAHGLLHLRGFDDKSTAGAAEMKRVQENLVAKVERAG